MSVRTPPLPALRAFAAVVRLGSVRAAAETLSLTQGAVTHQIRSLEEFLGVSLVQRDGRQLTLTDEGRIYGYQVRQALEDIVEATLRVQGTGLASRDSKPLRLAVLPSFVHGWLMPRLGGFRKQHPSIRLSLQASMSFVDLSQGKVDAAIRFGHGQWQNAVTTPLMGDKLVLVGAPSLLQGRETWTLPQLLGLPILHSSENWAAWLSSVPGYDGSVRRPVPALEFSDSTHLLEAAKLGYGLALTRRVIADTMLSRGELQLAHPHQCEHTSAYFVLTPTGSSREPALDSFISWLQQTVDAKRI